jgi:hypothetical protein
VTYALLIALGPTEETVVHVFNAITVKSVAQIDRYDIKSLTKM